MKFKTNIKCAGCLATVSPFLNETAGESNWQVDLEDPNRILTVQGDKTEAQIVEALSDAGFIAEKI